jgi:gliding motility-associated lipoprotein GldB
MRQILYVLVLLILFSCTEKCDDYINEGELPIQLELVRYDDSLFQNKEFHYVYAFVKKNKRLVRYFFDSPAIKGDNDSAFASYILKILKHPSLDTVYQDVKRVYGNFEDLKKELEHAYRHIKFFYPDFYLPKLVTLISGFGNDMLVTDSLVVISLENFLGEACKYRPDVPNYIYRRMRKQYIVPTIILATSNKFNKTNLLDQTLLAHMVWHGKALYFTKAMMPCVHDSIIIGYTGKELAGANAHEGLIWGHFIERDLLFSTSHTVEKYVNERPYTAEIGSKCPGRIGRWLGWIIVSKYVDETGISLPELMKETDANKILTLSKYKPKR